MQTVRLGSTGPDVRLLQSTLNRIGFYAGNTDGLFGPATNRAVVSFQQNYGLTPDGIVGPATWAALSNFILGYADYTIRPGDTFYKIARKFYTPLSSILTANPSLNPDNLPIGQRIVVPYGIDVVPYDIAYTYEILELLIRGLKARYPFLEVGSIGQSVMGKTLYYIRLGRGPKKLSYNAAHHANEWITVGILMKFIENYARAYSTGSYIRGYYVPNLYDTASIYVIPMVNPDGVDLVNYWPDYQDPVYERAALLNTTGQPLPNIWKANIQGTDLNLNYPASWEREHQLEISQGITGPAPRDYGGPAPLSAPESAAMAEFTRRMDFGLVIAYHTQGNVIFWQFENYAPPNAQTIAEAFGKVSGYAVAGGIPEAAWAGYKDWFILEFGRPGFTIEAGSGTNPLPVSDLPAIYERNEEILLMAPLVY